MWFGCCTVHSVLMSICRRDTVRPVLMSICRCGKVHSVFVSTGRCDAVRSVIRSILSFSVILCLSLSYSLSNATSPGIIHEINQAQNSTHIELSKQNKNLQKNVINGSIYHQPVLAPSTRWATYYPNQWWHSLLTHICVTPRRFVSP